MMRNDGWNNRHISVHAKRNVYRTVILTALLYGAETWTVYRTQVKRLHAVMAKQLPTILNLTWKDKVGHQCRNSEAYGHTVNG